MVEALTISERQITMIQNKRCSKLALAGKRSKEFFSRKNNRSIQVK
jgi:hypothetical protein